jgi:hypothetical protein
MSDMLQLVADSSQKVSLARLRQAKAYRTKKGRDCGGFNLRVCLATFSLRQNTFVPADQALDLRVGVALTISLIVKVKDTT